MSRPVRDRRLARGAVAYALALALAVGAVALLGYSSTLNPIDAVLGRAPVVEVPDVAEDTEPRARLAIEEAGLVAVAVPTFSLTVPRGSVAGQDPAAGAAVREGSTVEILVSQGLDRVEMPDAVGEPIDEVLAPFEDAGILVEIERVPDDRVPTDVVLEQSPGPGLQVTGVDPVRFVVSDGPADRPVPEIVGLSLQAAGFELGAAGLVPGEATIVEDPSVPVGGIVAADPAPGTVVEVDTEVALTVSVGPTPVEVPDVVGDTEAAARSALRGLGFDVVVAGRLVGEDEGGVGSVVQQYPDPTTTHQPGSSVTIVVGRPPPAPPPPTTTTTTTTTTVPPAPAPDDGDEGGDDD